MARIRRCWGALLDQACRTAAVPPEFLAALVANESGGNPRAARFESGVFRHLQAVREGGEQAYGSLTAESIDEAQHHMVLGEEIGQVEDRSPTARAKTHEYHACFLNEKFAEEVGAPVGRRVPLQDDQVLRELATSWGLTQIMGYHMIGRRSIFDRPGAPADLVKPEVNLRVALELLAEFAERYQLDPHAEFSEFFRCWNTGRPDGKPTFDPDYVEKGLRRMVIYRELAEEL